MTELLLILSLAPLTTPIDDCAKTRSCAAASETYEICVWPRTCSSKARETVAQFQPCVWPNTCAKPVGAPVLAQFQPCVWPNKCSGKRSEDVVL